MNKNRKKLILAFTLFTRSFIGKSLLKP